MLYWHFDGSTSVVDLTQNMAALYNIGFLLKLQPGPHCAGCCTGTQRCPGEPRRRREAEDVQNGVLFPCCTAGGAEAQQD